MSAPIFRPRMYAQLTVPVLGAKKEVQDKDGGVNALTLPIRVRRANLISNDHNHADELKLTVEWSDAGTDPRYLSSATVEFYLGQAVDARPWTPKPSDLRFVGVMTRPQRKAAGGEGLSVELEFHDYTAFFLEIREFATAGVPHFSMTLSEAWRLICDYTGSDNPATGVFSSTVDQLRDSIVFSGGASDVQIGSAVAQRFRGLGKVQVKSRGDAWAVWQQCVGMCGLISYIYLDQCIVTTATDYYSGPDPALKGTSTADDPPRMIWGKNIAAMSEARNPMRGGRAVGVTSFDPLTGTTLEAIYPPPGDASVFHKKISAKKRGNPTAIRQAADIEYFEYPGVTDPDRLAEVAKRAYEERSRQEMEGTIRTSEMAVDTVYGESFDLLALKAGDVVRIEFDQGTNDALANLSSDDACIDYLVRHGHSQDLAELVVANCSDFVQLQHMFLTKRVAMTLETTPEGGSFDLEISYCNRITITGDALKT